eukprot:1340089-Lingulodinium_polyedra.AAC.1
MLGCGAPLLDLGNVALGRARASSSRARALPSTCDARLLALRHARRGAVLRAFLAVHAAALPSASTTTVPSS